MSLPSISSSAATDAVRVSSADVVKLECFDADTPLPLVVRPAVDGLNLASWAAANRELLEERLLHHGAILFRDFDVRTVGDFERLAEAASTGLMEYRDRSSPRHEVGANVYTSTDYPPDQSIFPHNEQSYTKTFPLKLFFFCMTAAPQGGETPLADTRRVLARIGPETRRRFEERRWMYVRNFGDGFGLPWQTVFQTTDRAVVEEHCRKTGIECEWKSGNRLRTRQVRPAMAEHPRTGEMLWFNHATFFHVSTLAPAIREALLATFAEDDLPNNTFYGDGSPIEPDVLDELRAAYAEEQVSFAWKEGDVVMLDNMLTAHSRLPYAGPRRVLFAMTEPITRRDI